jgi:hypothetical protein
MSFSRPSAPALYLTSSPSSSSSDGFEV